jgi:hypothetical protein
MARSKKTTKPRSSAGAEEETSSEEMEEEKAFKSPPKNRPTAAGTARGGEGGKAVGKGKKALTVDGEITRGIWHGGKAYGPGDEALFMKAGVPKASMQRLANQGAIIGFGFEAEEAEEVEEGEEVEDEE